MIINRSRIKIFAPHFFSQAGLPKYIYYLVSPIHCLLLPPLLPLCPSIIPSTHAFPALLILSSLQPSVSRFTNPLPLLTIHQLVILTIFSAHPSADVSIFSPLNPFHGGSTIHLPLCLRIGRSSLPFFAPPIIFLLNPSIPRSSHPFSAPTMHSLLSPFIGH